MIVSVRLDMFVVLGDILVRFRTEIAVEFLESREDRCGRFRFLERDFLRMIR